MKNFLLIIALAFTGIFVLSSPLRSSFGQEQLTRTVEDDVGGTTVSRIAEGQDVLRILADLRRLVLDDEIFFDPVFQSLIDYSFPLSPEPRGRPNPFAPLGQDIQRFNPDVRNLTGAPEIEVATSTGNEVIIVPIGL